MVIGDISELLVSDLCKGLGDVGREDTEDVLAVFGKVAGRCGEIITSL